MRIGRAAAARPRPGRAAGERAARAAREAGRSGAVGGEPLRSGRTVSSATLDAPNRFRLKLANPLGVGKALAQRYSTIAAERLTLMLRTT